MRHVHTSSSDNASVLKTCEKAIKKAREPPRSANRGENIKNRWGGLCTVRMVFISRPSALVPCQSRKKDETLLHSIEKGIPAESGRRLTLDVSKRHTSRETRAAQRQRQARGTHPAAKEGAPCASSLNLQTVKRNRNMGDGDGAL